MKNSKSKAKPNKKKQPSKEMTDSKLEQSKSTGTDYVRSTKSPVNDPAWYSTLPDLTATLGNGGFAHVTGTAIPAGKLGYFKDPSIAVNFIVPNWGSDVTVNAKGAVDVSKGSMAGINASLTKLYAFVVHRNGRHPGYQAKDLLMTIMAIDGLYQHIREGERIYRLATAYNPQNDAAGRAITALCWDKTSVINSLAQFRYDLERAKDLVNKFMIPNIFPIINYHNSLFSQIYLDEPSD